MRKINLKPRFLEFAPQTPLNERLHGPQYQHHLVCNYWTKPVGSPGCVCIRALRHTYSWDDAPPLWKYFNDWCRGLDERYGK